MSEPRLDARAAAALAVAGVFRGQSLNACLPALAARVAAEDRGLVQELAFGVLREHERLDFLLGRLLKRPLKARDADVRSLLLVGLYQLRSLRIPGHAAVNETVAATRVLGKGWARGLVNGVLRNAQRRTAELERALESAPETVQAGLPGWLLERLRDDWPDDWQALAAAANARPPMVLRVNRRRGDREACLRRLEAAGIGCAAHAVAPAGIELERPVAVDALPGFAEGEVSVQDGAAQLCVELLDARPGQRVLDACAAPGGKTAAVLEATESLEMLALDVDGERLARVDETLERLGLEAQTCTADAADTGTWWDGRPFDRILLDAPCTGTGVIRRHPDIKHLRQPGDVERLAARQAALLEALWPLLAPGGRLVYATCSVLRAENDHGIRGFLERQPGAVAVPVEADWGRCLPAGRQILTGEAGMDGFYYACLDKRTDGGGDGA